MRSLYAVAVQIALSASNYVVFVILTRMLSEVDFVAFATAVGLSMFAYAVAEGGVSYVAPRVLADRNDAHASAIAGAFIAISISLYIISLIVGFFLWNALSNDQLNIKWVIVYALYFGPAIFIPSWVTCWSMDRFCVVIFVIVRLVIVTMLYFQPGPQALALSGVGFFVFVVWLLNRLNRVERVVAWVNTKSFAIALGLLREVFFAKTMSYTLYSLLPLIVGVLRGNSAASDYVIGERIKSLYATVFQPLIQIIYLRLFQSDNRSYQKNIITWVINIINLLICIGLIFVIQTGGFAFLGERFLTLVNITEYIVAAALSVATASLLYFKVFPSGDYTIFRRASIVQFVIFVILFVGLNFFEYLSPALVLCLGESMLLFAVLIQLFFRSK